MSGYTIMSENGRLHIVHEESQRWITTLTGGDGIIVGSKVVKILNTEIAPLHTEIAVLKADKAKLLGAVEYVMKALENAPSDSQEIRDKASLVYESLNEWHATLIDAYENSNPSESEAE